MNGIFGNCRMMMSRDKGLLIAAILYLCASIYSAGHAANNPRIETGHSSAAWGAFIVPMVYWSIELQRKDDDE